MACHLTTSAGEGAEVLGWGETVFLGLIHGFDPRGWGNGVALGNDAGEVA